MLFGGQAEAISHRHLPYLPLPSFLLLRDASLLLFDYLQTIIILCLNHNMTKPDKFVELLATCNTTEIVMIQSILDGAGIKYVFVGKPLGRIYPTLTKPARLMVEKDKLAIARELLKDLKFK